MQNLTIDTGVQEFSVNGRGVLRFNPGDPNVYHRFFAAKEPLAQLDEELTAALRAMEGETLSEEDRAIRVLALMADYDRRVKALLTDIFGEANNFDVILEGVNLAGVGANGQRVVQNLLEALAPVLADGAQRTVTGKADAAVAAAEAGRAARQALPA